jgi:uncharacterized protein
MNGICTVIFAVVLLGNAWIVQASPSTENDVLASLASKGIDTHLTKVVETASSLDNAIMLLCEKKDATSFKQAQSVWKDAYMAWRRAAPFLIEPANTLERYLGQPANDLVLKGVVESDNLADMRNGTDVRGYAGVEYLLFVPENATLATADLRCQHLAEISSEIVIRTTTAKIRWNKEFREGFVSAGNGLPYMVPGDALSLLVAELLNAMETVLRDSLLFPSNLFKGEAKPELLEAWHSKSSLDALQAVVDGLSVALTGNGDNSLTELIATKDGLTHKKDPALAKAIRKQLTKIQKSIDKLNKKDVVLYTQLQKDSKTLKRVYRDLRKLQEKVAEAILVLELDIRQGLEADLTQ